MCCREQRNMSLDDDLIPTSLEIGTKPLDLATLVHTRLSWRRTPLPRYLLTCQGAHYTARTSSELQALIDLQWSKASAAASPPLNFPRRAETTH